MTTNSIYAAAYENGRRNAIRIGLSHIMRLPRQAMERIVRQRGDGYISLEDFLTRAAIHQSEAETLAYCGAMPGFGHTRPELIWKIRLWEGVSHAGQTNRPDGKNMGNGDIAFIHPVAISPAIPSLPDYPLGKRMECEREALGFHASINPVTAFMSGIAPVKGIVKAASLRLYAGREVRLVGRVVTAKRTRTVHGEFMKFLTMEDDTDIFEVILFPRAYACNSQGLANPGVLLVTGNVEADHGDVSVVGKAVSPLNFGNPQMGIRVAWPR